MYNMTQGCTLFSKREYLQPGVLANIIMFMCFFPFYYLFVFHILPQAGVNDTITIMQASFLLTVTLTIFVASHLTPNLGKKHITISSLGMIATLPLLLLLKGYPYALFPIFLISVFFGISQLAFYKVFWNSTNSGKRSKIAGIIGFSAVSLYFITIVSASEFNLFENTALGLFLIAGITIGSILSNEGIKKNENTKKVVYYPEKRTIILFAVPWLFFSFLNVTLTKNITIVTSALNSSSTYLLLYGAQVIGGVLGALIGGYFADRAGRRLTLVFSVALYGVSMAFRGFTDNNVTLLFSFIGEGLTWGIFLTLYCFIIWGDLSNTENVEKIYAIGLTTFYATACLGVFNLFANIPVVESTLISCIMIFLAIIPIVLAPELITSDAQEKNKLRKYMETVRKVADESE